MKRAGAQVEGRVRPRGLLRLQSGAPLRRQSPGIAGVFAENT